MPLAKSAPNINPEPTAPEVKPPANQVVSPVELGFDGIPFEIYRFFDLKIPMSDSKDIEKIRDIYKWASSESGSVGDALLKIRSLEMKLGYPRLGESRFSKLWNWVRLTDHINDLQKQKEAYLENPRTEGTGEALNRLNHPEEYKQEKE